MCNQKNIMKKHVCDKPLKNEKEINLSTICKLEITRNTQMLYCFFENRFVNINGKEIQNYYNSAAGLMF